MKASITLLALVLLVGCSGENARKAQEEAAAEMKAAREALAAEINQDMAAAEETMANLRAKIEGLEHEAVDAYHRALNEGDVALDAAKADWARATEATEEAWQEVGAKSRDETARIKEATRRLEALTSDVKDDFVREADTVLDEIRADVDALQAKAAKLDDEGRTQYDKLAAEFKKDYEATIKELDRAKDAADDTWKKAQHDVNHVLLKLKTKLKEAYDTLEKG